MKSMKKILCVLLAVMMALGTFAMSVSAESATDAIVAKIYVCARVKSVGHAWVYVENVSSKELTVGAYKLPVKQGVTISAYNTARKDGKGNYYNIDAYCLNKYGKSGTVCAVKEVTESQLEKVSNKILSRNTWTGLKNCCYFASSVWNAAGGKQIKNSPSPLVFKSYIKKIKCSTPSFYVPAKSQCFKQVGTGLSSTLKPCSSGSYHRYVG